MRSGHKRDRSFEYLCSSTKRISHTLDEKSDKLSSMMKKVQSLILWKKKELQKSLDTDHYKISEAYNQQILDISQQIHNLGEFYFIADQNAECGIALLTPPIVGLFKNGSDVLQLVKPSNSNLIYQLLQKPHPIGWYQLNIFTTREALVATANINKQATAYIITAITGGALQSIGAAEREAYKKEAVRLVNLFNNGAVFLDFVIKAKDDQGCLLQESLFYISKLAHAELSQLFAKDIPSFLTLVSKFYRFALALVRSEPQFFTSLLKDHSDAVFRIFENRPFHEMMVFCRSLNWSNEDTELSYLKFVNEKKNASVEKKVKP